MRNLTAFLVICSFGAIPAFANGEAVSKQPAEQAPKDQTVKCKRLDDDNTGSNMKRWKKVCKPVSQWEAEERELERRLSDRRNSG